MNSAAIHTNKNKKKPQLTQKQIAEIQWLNKPRKKDAIRVGRFKEYWILSQSKPDTPVLVYDQAEWDAFVDGVEKHEFDDLAK